jgi:2-polyprenyl-3-methyl-5-hydroxy-6-metoxy-1,4-benzoquinol methylase
MPVHAGQAASVSQQNWEAYYRAHTDDQVLWNARGADASLVAAVAQYTSRNRKEPGAGWHGLDVGCGLGHDSLFMLRHNFTHVTCLDSSNHALASARTRITQHLDVTDASTEFVEAFLGEPNRFPLGTRERYDLIWIRSVMQHLSDETLRRMVTYLTSLLRPGGMLVAKEFDPAACAGAIGSNGTRLVCGQAMGPRNSRSAPQLLQLIRTAAASGGKTAPACKATASKLRASCGSQVCAQVYECSVHGPTVWPSRSRLQPTSAVTSIAPPAALLLCAAGALALALRGRISRLWAYSSLASTERFSDRARVRELGVELPASSASEL